MGNDRRRRPDDGRSGQNELRARETYPEGWSYGSTASFAREDRRVSPVRYIGLDDDRAMGWSRWWLRLSDNFDTLSASDGIATLSVQRTPADVRRVDVPGRSTVGSISLLPTSGSVWRSDVAFEFDQFYLRQDHLSRIHEALWGRGLAPGDLEPFTGVDDPGMFALLDRAAHAITAPETSLLELDAWALEIGEWLLRRCPSYERPPTRHARLRGQPLTDVLDFIEDHLGEPLKVARLAEVAGLSEYHMVRAFRSAMGRTPHQFVLERRIDRAAAILVGSARPLAEIALELGFASQAHFNDAFRNRRGVSPGRYRRDAADG